MIAGKNTCAAILALLLMSSTLVQASEVPTSADIGSTAERGAPAVANEFVMKFQPDTSATTRDQIARSLRGRIVGHIPALDVYTIRLAPSSKNGEPLTREENLAMLQRIPQVVYAEPNYLYSINWTPNDPALEQQWAWNVIDAFEGWDITRGSNRTVVAIVDTGIQLNHPDLNAKIVEGYDFVQNDNTPNDENGHGTHVAGTSAAETNNRTGGAGTCPNCRLMPVRVLNRFGIGTLANVARGITYAANNGAKVINLSVGGTTDSTTLRDAVDYAWGQGAFLACAAGNSNTTAPLYPAYYNNCFAVASTGRGDTRSSFSNYGNWVEVAAPGEDIYSTWRNSNYNTISGTSMAAPHVAGLAGLLASQGLNNAQIRDRICATADAIAGTGNFWICGRINVRNAVAP